VSVCVAKDCRRPTWDPSDNPKSKSKHCIDHHPHGLSGPSLAQQLQKARDDNADLAAELRATRAVVVAERMEPDTPGRPRSPDFERQVQIARALLGAQDAEKALTGAAVGGTDGRPTVRRRNDYPQPGSATAGARRAAKDLRRDLDRAVQAFEAAKQREWRRPVEDDQPPKLKCGIRGCSARDVEVPAWRFVRGGRRITKTHCEACGTRLKGAVSDEEESA